MRHLGRCLAAMVALAAVVAPTTGKADYPDKPIHMILPFSAGGETDPLARLISEHISKALGQPIVVENRPGASGAVAFNYVAKSPADGYTLLWAINTHLSVNPILYPNATYDVEKDFTPITSIAEAQFVMAVNPSVPAKTVEELVAYAKAHPNTLKFSSAGVGSPIHLPGALFADRTGTELIHVPYKSGGDAALSVLSGETDIVFGSISGSLSNIRAGKVVPLAVTGQHRAAPLPDVPTMTEAGVPDYEGTIWHLILAPEGTPEEVVARIRGEAAKALAEPDVLQALTRVGLRPFELDGAGIERRVEAESAQWKTLLHEVGLQQ